MSWRGGAHFCPGGCDTLVLGDWEQQSFPVLPQYLRNDCAMHLSFSHSVGTSSPCALAATYSLQQLFGVSLCYCAYGRHAEPFLTQYVTLFVELLLFFKVKVQVALW